MRFWLTTATRYLLAGSAALLFSIITSFLITSAFVGPNENIPALAALSMIGFLLMIGEASLLVPLSLGITAELVERRIRMRRFQWSKALWRSLVALPIAVGPLYYVLFVAMYIDSHRPSHWVQKDAILYFVSAVFAYCALRIEAPRHVSPD